MSDGPGERRAAIAARAWRYRCWVEREAQARFARLAGWLDQAGLPGQLVGLATRSSRDEARHAIHCAALTELHGGTLADLPAVAPPVLAPSALPPRAALLYEAVAACCVTETGSVGVLTELLGSVRGGRLRAILRELASDEVRHSQLGWAVLAAERERGTAELLGPFVPAMLAGSIDAGLFGPAPPGEDDEALLETGVLPHALRREVFTRTALEVVLPGLAQGGVDPEPARRWLEERQAAAASPVALEPPSGR